MGGVYPSADVDIPYSPGNKNLKRLIRRLGGDLVRRRSVPDFGRTVASFLLSKFGKLHLDPFYPWLDWLMTVNEEANNRMLFYFIADRRRHRWLL